MCAAAYSHDSHSLLAQDLAQSVGARLLVIDANAVFGVYVGESEVANSCGTTSF
jgi:hypothetical protein